MESFIAAWQNNEWFLIELKWVNIVPCLYLIEKTGGLQLTSRHPWSHKQRWFTFLQGAFAFEKCRFPKIGVPILWLCAHWMFGPVCLQNMLSVILHSDLPRLACLFKSGEQNEHAQWYGTKHFYCWISGSFILVIHKQILQHITNMYLRYKKQWGIKWAHICKPRWYKRILQNIQRKSQGK